jgi:hypothetical protein
MTEDRLQQSCYVWFHNEYPELRGLLFHVPNGGARNGFEAKKFKWMGVVPGVADLIFLFNKKAYFIELKTEKGTQSKVQKEWENTVIVQGFNYHILRSLEEFQRLIKSIIV